VTSIGLPPTASALERIAANQNIVSGALAIQIVLGTESGDRPGSNGKRVICLDGALAEEGAGILLRSVFAAFKFCADVMLPRLKSG
jgi:hypothetical protein